MTSARTVKQARMIAGRRTTLDINSHGVVVGQCETDLVDEHGRPRSLAVLVQGKTINVLGSLPGFAHSLACAINDHGLVVGYAYNLDRHGHRSGIRAVTFEPTGAVTDLGTLGGEASAALGVSPNGDVVGWAETPAGEQHAFLCQEGAMTDLGTLGGRRSVAHDVNSRGQVVGGSDLIEPGQHRAFLWDRGVMWNLGTLGGPYSRAFAVNEAGTIIGVADTTNGDRHRVVFADAVVTDLGMFGATYDPASGIDDPGPALGEADRCTVTAHALRWDDEEMRHLSE